MVEVPSNLFTLLGINSSRINSDALSETDISHTLAHSNFQVL